MTSRDDPVEFEPSESASSCWIPLWKDSLNRNRQSSKSGMTINTKRWKLFQYGYFDIDSYLTHQSLPALFVVESNAAQDQGHNPEEAVNEKEGDDLVVNHTEKETDEETTMSVPWWRQEDDGDESVYEMVNEMDGIKKPAMRIKLKHARQMRNKIKFMEEVLMSAGTRSYYMDDSD